MENKQPAMSCQQEQVYGVGITDDRLQQSLELKPLHAGVHLDHYRIENLVARSGMASIYRATNLRTGTVVAIKLPHPEMLEDPAFCGRFEREQEIGLQLSHPSVLRVFPDDKRSRMYMVMEWVGGRLLRAVLIEQKKLSPVRAVRIAKRIAEALQYIHSQGVAHRDLKPENIMIDAEDRIKIIDFGIASSASSRRLTFRKSSETLGTPDYISPEQVQGKKGDARSDIYALGVMLYEMLTGEVPFTGANPFVVMNDRLVNNPVPPREIDPKISPQLQEIVYRAMERDLGKRYQNAGQFVWDLEHQDEVEAAERLELRNWTRKQQPAARVVLFYSMLALIPVAVFAALLWVARH